MVNGFKTWIFSGYSVKATHVIAPPLPLTPRHLQDKERYWFKVLYFIFILIINLIFNLILILILIYILINEKV